MKTSVFVLVAFAGLVAVIAVPTMAQVKKGKTRLLTTHHLMEGLVKVQCSDLKKVLDEGPTDDRAWNQADLHASLLNEASFVLMDDGRCPDGTWANAASKLLRNGSAAVVEAVRKKDVEAARHAFAEMTKACGTCHKAHKKKD